MSSRVTELDRHLAKRMKVFRESNPDANMSKLARLLGIRYQSYQAMEKGEVSIRVSTVQRLALFYGVGLEEFIGEDAPGTVPNMGRISYIIDAVIQMHPEDASDTLRFALERVNGAK
jgi:transcriptional regulator with XRE-family HTH domain